MQIPKSTAQSSEAGLHVGASADENQGGRMVKLTPAKTRKASPVGGRHIEDIESYNLAKRVALNILPEFLETKRMMLTTVPTFRTAENDELYPVPNRIEVVPDDEEGVEQLNGGYSRALQKFHCENVVIPHHDTQCVI